MKENTALSPDAQAVLDAYENTIGYRQGFAAAIRELLEQVLPEHRPHYPLTLDEQHRKVDAWVIRDKVLRVVAELEAL